MRKLTTVAKHLAIGLCSITFVACACSGDSQSTSPRVSSGIADASAETLTAPGCMRTGCSNHICAEQGEPVVSTCQWREEYACYKSARCEKQSNGKCGWTETKELTSCIQSATEQQQGLNLSPK